MQSEMIDERIDVAVPVEQHIAIHDVVGNAATEEQIVAPSSRRRPRLRMSALIEIRADRQ
jgi:hypothetical protein